VIAGYDLKFIKPALPELKEYFDIRLDEWQGHAEHEHDEAESRKLLNWAEFIWCEWLLGNSVWYAENKMAHQRLITRIHRFELDRDFGEKIKIDNLDAITAVSVHFFERLLERFPDIPRAKARLLPNFVRTEDYKIDFDEQRLFTLGVIGILPARKRFDRALRILCSLRKIDARYRMEVFGNSPGELHWVATNKKEMDYFADCDRMIDEYSIKNAVTFHGHTNLKSALSEKKVGFVLSTSDSSHGFPGSESFHLAVADAFAGGAIGLIQHWLGAEYIWPEEFILPTEEAVAERILNFRNKPEAFQQASRRGRQFIEERYGTKKFAVSVKELFSELL